MKKGLKVKIKENTDKYVSPSQGKPKKKPHLPTTKA
jgi:hypothetical protein